MHPHHYDKHAAEAHPGSAGTTTRMQTPIPSGERKQKAQSISVEDIRLCAYRKWESAGKPTGDGLQFWLAAEQELTEGKSIASH